MPAADADPLLVEKIPQHAAARKREFEVQLVHPAHDGQIGRRHRSGQVIDAATADPKRLGLLGDRQIMGAVDHRFALSRPALLSAPDKRLVPGLNGGRWLASTRRSWRAAFSRRRLAWPGPISAPTRTPRPPPPGAEPSRPGSGWDERQTAAPVRPASSHPLRQPGPPSL